MESAPLAHVRTRFFIAEDVKAVSKPEHAIAVNAVELGNRTYVGRQRTADIGLLLQNIVNLETDSSGISFQKVLRNLGIPDKFIPVHTCIPVATAGIVGNISRQRHLPRQGDVGAHSIAIGVRLLIVFRTQFVTLESVPDRPVHRNLEPVITESTVQMFSQQERSATCLVIQLRLIVIEIRYEIAVTGT